MAQHASHILDMARKGAEHKYAELKAEIAALVKHFPHLTAGKGGIVSRGTAALAKGRKAVTAELARPKRTMSAKARKAISDAQKRRWAKQKAGEKK
jgi:hypothetical protein